MLNTGLRLWQRLLAEETKSTLREYESVEGRRGHKASNVLLTGARVVRARPVERLVRAFTDHVSW